MYSCLHKVSLCSKTVPSIKHLLNVYNNARQCAKYGGNIHEQENTASHPQGGSTLIEEEDKWEAGEDGEGQTLGKILMRSEIHTSGRCRCLNSVVMATRCSKGPQNGILSASPRSIHLEGTIISVGIEM